MDKNAKECGWRSKHHDWHVTRQIGAGEGATSATTRYHVECTRCPIKRADDVYTYDLAKPEDLAEFLFELRAVCRNDVHPQVVLETPAP